MTNGVSQVGMEFFFEFDNAFFSPFKQGEPKYYAAVGPGMNVAAAFYASPSEFASAIKDNATALAVIGDKTIQLVQDTLGGFGDDLRQAFENFGQGVLWDDRRNTAEYLYWAVHTMDSIAASQAQQYGARSGGPSEYPNWYGANRGISDLGVGDPADWLQMGRFIAMAAAIQNVARPWCAVGPSQYQSKRFSRLPLPPTDQPWSESDKAHNKPIPDTVTKFCELYQDISQADLDHAFKQARSQPFGQAGKYGNPLQVPADY